MLQYIPDYLALTIHQLLIDRYHRIMLNDDFHPKRPPLPFDKQYITVVNRCKVGK